MKIRTAKIIAADARRRPPPQERGRPARECLARSRWRQSACQRTIAQGYRRRPACEFAGRLAPSRHGRRDAARTRRRDACGTPAPTLRLTDPHEGTSAPHAVPALRFSSRRRLSILAKDRAVRTGVSVSLSSVRNGGEGRGEEALRNDGAARVGEAPLSPALSPFVPHGARETERDSFERFRHELSQRLLPRCA